MVLELHSFNDIDEFKPFKKVSGIYALIYNNSIIYVGQSKDIGNRLRNHSYADSRIRAIKKEMEKDKDNIYINSNKLRIEFYTFIFNHRNEIQFIVLPLDINELNRNEELYINKYKPIYNYSGVIKEYKPQNRQEV